MVSSTAPGEVHQIVVIGASFGGLPSTHKLLQQILPAVETTTKQKYKVVLIAPNDHFYFKVGAPRMIINPAKFPLDKGLLPFRDSFKQYPADRFEFVHAYASAIDPVAKTVATSTNQTIRYDSLVIASGTNFKSALWTVNDGESALREAVAELHKTLPTAASVLIAGGGAVGVETAGEIADLYGGKKEIVLLSGSDQLLSRLHNKGPGKEAETRLVKMGVQVLHNLRVTDQTKAADGKTSLTLGDGSTRIVDVYIESTGDRPNSNFVPPAWLNERGYVKTHPQTLRLDVEGVAGVYCIGTVGSYSDGSIADTKLANSTLLDSVRRDLLGIGENPSTSSSAPPNSASATAPPVGWIEWLTSWVPFTAAADAAAKKPTLYKKMAETQFVPIGPAAGVGIVMGWRIPGFVVVMLKSKTYFMSDVHKVVDGPY